METISHAYLGELLVPEDPGTFVIAYTPNIVNKTPVNRQHKFVNGNKVDTTYTENFHEEWVDYDRLSQIVCGEGWSISRPFEGSKRDDTITVISYIGLDFDDTDPELFEKVKSHPFVEGRGFFHYSASHGSPDKPGVNGHWICPLEYGARIDTPEHRKAWKLVLEQITELFPVDRKAKDLQRLFYGAKGKQSEVWGEEFIGIEEIEMLYLNGKAREQQLAANRQSALKNSRNSRSRTRYTFEEAVRMTQQYVLPQLVDGAFPDVELSDKSPDGTASTRVMDSYDAWLHYFVGWSQEIGLDAAAKLMDQFAPDRTMGSFNKLKSFNKAGTDPSRQITFGSTMKLLFTWGFDPREEAFGQTVIAADRLLNPGKRYIEMPDIDTEHKCVMVKSPKGTGKTALIDKIASSGLNVLVLGHRRTLLRNTTGRTGIPNYQDVVPAEANSLCITLDSLHRLDLKRQHFDVIIIDEVEQVLQHCTGETLAESRPLELSIFRWLLGKADKIYCFDADISFVSINFFQRHLGPSNVFVVENRIRLGGKTIEMYPSRSDIMAMTRSELTAGKKLAIATNVKKEAHNFEKALKEEFPQLRIVTVTHDNSDQPDIQDFIQHIDDRIEEVDVLIYSPSLGTGVSIDKLHFDAIHLIGQQDITTHFDLDQQICRVRRTTSGIVRAFIGFNDTEVGRKDTDPEILRRTCVDNAFQSGVRISILSDGTIVGDTSDAWYIELWADIQALRHRSMNNIKNCFMQLMRDQGHHVVFSKVTQAERAQATSRIKAARDSLNQARVDEILDARMLTELEYSELLGKDFVPLAEKREIEKFEMFDFYQLPVTEELVNLDKEGRFKEPVILAEMVTGQESADAYDAMEAAVKTGLMEIDSRIMVPHRRFFGPTQVIINELLEKAGLGSLYGYDLGQGYNDGLPFSATGLKTNGFVDWLGQKEVQDRITRYLQLPIRSNFADQSVLLIGQVLRRLGLEIAEKRKRETVNGQTHWVREYSIIQSTVKILADILAARKRRSALQADSTAILGSIIRYSYEMMGQPREVMVAARDIISFASKEALSAENQKLEL